MSTPVTAVAVGGKVRIEFPVAADHWTITPEQADALWNAIAEAELVALEQRVRARRRVTEGARGGWVNAPAQGRHAAGPVRRACPDGGTCRHQCAQDTCFRVLCCGPLSGTYPDDQWPAEVYTKYALGPPVAVDAGMALAESTAAALNRLAPEGGWRQRAAAMAAPEPGDPYPAPDYQHPDDDE